MDYHTNGTLNTCLIYSVSTSATQSAYNLNVTLLLQLAVTAIGVFTLLAVVIIGVIICRRSSTTVGLYSYNLKL